MPLDSFRIIFGYALTVCIHNAKAILGDGVALFGQGLPFFERGGLVRLVVCSPTFNKASPSRSAQTEQSAACLRGEGGEFSAAKQTSVMRHNAPPFHRKNSNAPLMRNEAIP